MKKRGWIILICVIILSGIGIAIWNFGFKERYPDYGFGFNEETGCYMVECGPLLNCQRMDVCPGDAGFRERRKGVKPLKEIKNCCSKYTAKGEECDCGGVVSYRQDCDCGVYPIFNSDGNVRTLPDDYMEEKLKGCILYFDGCNTYDFEYGAGTETACFQYDKPKCLKYKDDKK